MFPSGVGAAGRAESSTPTREDRLRPAAPPIRESALAAAASARHRARSRARRARRSTWARPRTRGRARTSRAMNPAVARARKSVERPPTTSRAQKRIRRLHASATRRVAHHGVDDADARAREVRGKRRSDGESVGRRRPERHANACDARQETRRDRSVPKRCRREGAAARRELDRRDRSQITGAKIEAVHRPRAPSATSVEGRRPKRAGGAGAGG